MYQHASSHTPSSDGTVGMSSLALGWNTKEEVAILKESCFPETALATGLTVSVIAVTGSRASWTMVETSHAAIGHPRYLAPRETMDIARHQSYDVPSPNPLDRGKTSPRNLAKSSPLSSPEPPSEYSSDRPEPKYCLLLALGRGRPLIVRGPVPRNPSNIDCWLLAQIFTTTVWRRLWERQFSMHLRSRNLPRPSASSSWDNRAPPMANTSQIPDLEGLHHEIHGMAEQMRVMNENNARLIQLLAAANPQPPAAPSVPDAERSRHSNRSGDRSHNVSTERARGRRRALSPSLRERSSSSESSQTRPRVRRGRSPRRGDHTKARDKSTLQKIRDLDARLDAINTGTNAQVTVDTLVRQMDPPFTERVLGARISSKFKLPTQLGIYEGKTDPMDHLDSYKRLMSLQGCSDEVMCKAFSATLKGPARNRQKNASHLFTIHQKETESLKDFVKRFNQATLEVEDPSDKVIIMAMMEGLRPGPLFDSLSKNVPETLSTLQSKADKYIAAEELAEAKRRRPRTPPRRPKFILPPLNAPVAQDFIVVDCPSPYNAILGRPTLGGIKAITSTYHLKMKFPTLTGIGEVKGDQKVARQCFISAMKVGTSVQSAQ
ncbi:hypothetical protein Acr_25g0005850 [Actinidia rufa]|uniref:Retrotransposon gag domain-containing protein n=1 Tax=Actinidia rufa TaxID=165716 RepID=A0A7J0GZF5_9ERIC|nr:hypothetical protein Acr_25g0005850 [Actinidia rufa]